MEGLGAVEAVQDTLVQFVRVWSGCTPRQRALSALALLHFGLTQHFYCGRCGVRLRGFKVTRLVSEGTTLVGQKMPW